MGMAATQARLISLKARMSNVEYQGQQINQERTILSQQATDLYTSLLAMSVPTPPSTQDYAIITYAGIDGNTTFTLGNVKPSGEKYIVEINQTATGNAIVSDYGSVAANRLYTEKEAQEDPDHRKAAKIKLSAVTELPGVLYEADLQNYYIKDNSVPPNIIQLNRKKSDWVTEPDDKGKCEIKQLALDGYSLCIISSVGKEYDDPRAGQGSYTIGGKQAYDFDTAKQLFDKMFDWDKYEEAIRNTYGTSTGATNKDDFFVYVERSDTGVYSLKFALKADVESPDGFAQTYSYTANGKYTTSDETDKCILEFDTQGRIKKIGIPTFDKTTGEIISYKYIDLTAETSYDEAAYQDAYAQYEYKMYEYDKKNQEINAKTQILQEEDKNLELKLTRLDNERDALKNEMDACDKVLKDNIEKSFKTFSG